MKSTLPAIPDFTTQYHRQHKMMCYLKLYHQQEARHVRLNDLSFRNSGQEHINITPIKLVLIRSHVENDCLSRHIMNCSVRAGPSGSGYCMCLNMWDVHGMNDMAKMSICHRTLRRRSSELPFPPKTSGLYALQKHILYEGLLIRLSLRRFLTLRAVTPSTYVQIILFRNVSAVFVRGSDRQTVSKSEDE